MSSHGLMNLTVLQSLITISKLLVRFWETSRITRSQLHKSQPQRYKLSASTTEPNQLATSLIKLISCFANPSTHCEVTECHEGTILLTDTVLGWRVSVFADIDHEVLTRKHWPLYEINFLDGQSFKFERIWKIEDIPSSPESQHS